MTLTPPQNASIHILSTPQELGQLAASHIAQAIRDCLQTQPVVRIVFAAAPSQSEMLHALAQAKHVDWSRVEAFHMDEYIGLAPGAKQRFGEWLTREFFSRVALRKVHLIDPGVDPEQSANAYAACMAAQPIDIVCLGIGMNGHIAFNDPPADFAEPSDVRVVALDRMSREQQVKEGLFPSLDDVPTHALTLSVPRLLNARKLFCCVPGKIKQAAVARALTGPIDPSSPASILRSHPACMLYLDRESSAGLGANDR